MKVFRIICLKCKKKTDFEKPQGAFEIGCGFCGSKKVELIGKIKENNETGGKDE